jgi:Methyltransferase domain
MNFFDRYSAEFEPKLGIRAKGFKSILMALGYEAPIIVETGTTRTPGNWEGDGQSTVIFDALAAESGGHVWSVDISEDACNAARSLNLENTDIVCADSLMFLRRFGLPIDLLYLDSFDLDVNNPHLSAMHHMAELTVALPQLAPGCIVCVDDSPNGTGKGQYVTEFFEKIGVPPLVTGYQMAWRFEPWW